MQSLRDFKDAWVKQASITTRSGRKWAVSVATEQAESSSKAGNIIGNTYTGRQGLGSTHFQQFGKASTTIRQGMVQAEIQAQEEQRCTSAQA